MFEEWYVISSVSSLVDCTILSIMHAAVDILHDPHVLLPILPS